MTHPHDDLAVHALDALDGPDRRALGHHLAGCPTCRAELDDLRATAARMVRPVTPPPQVWTRITAALPADLGGTRDLPALSAAGGSSPAAGGQDLAGARGGAGVGEPVPRPGGRRSGGARSPGPGRGRWSAAVLATAAALAVLAGTVGFVAGRADGPPAPGVAALAEAALADPANPRAALTDPAGREEVARVVAGDDGAFVVLDGLDALPEGQTYQLWRFDGPTPVSLGVLGDGTTGALAVPLPPALRDRPAPLAITAEDAPGAATPSGLLVARGALPAP